MLGGGPPLGSLAQAGPCQACCEPPVALPGTQSARGGRTRDAGVKFLARLACPGCLLAPRRPSMALEPTFSRCAERGGGRNSPGFTASSSPLPDAPCQPASCCCSGCRARPSLGCKYFLRHGLSSRPSSSSCLGAQELTRAASPSRAAPPAAQAPLPPPPVAWARGREAWVRDWLPVEASAPPPGT